MTKRSMTKFSDIIMRCAAYVMPKTQADWMRAMRAEFMEVTHERTQLKFALGCLQTSMASAAQTRKGLSFIGRGLVALGLASFSVYGLLLISAQVPEPEFTALFTALCFYYAGAAGFTVLSLKGLRLYSALGLAGATLSWTGLKLTTYETAEISNVYLQALSFEWAIANMALIVAAIYLTLINTQDDATI